MTSPCAFGPPARTSRLVLALTLAGGLCAAGAFAQDEPLTLNDKQYFEKRGLNVLVFTNEYNGMFFDEKTAGIEIIHHGIRTATGGAVRLSPTPEQWDQIPKVVDRKVDAKTNTVEVTLRYEAFGFDSRVVVTPDGAGFRIAVYLDKPVPAELEGRAGLNLEFVPSRYWERTYLVDGQPGIFPRYPAGPTTSLPPEKKIRQFEGHSTFDLHGHPGLRRDAAGGRREDHRDGARGSRAPRDDSVPGGRAAAPRRPQPRPERLVRRALAAGDEGDRQGRRVVRRAAHDSRLDPHARDRLLAGGLPPLAAEARRHRAGRERQAAGSGLARRDPAGRPAGREAEGQGRAVGAVPPLPLRSGRLLGPSAIPASTSSSTASRGPARSPSPATSTSGSGTRRSTCSSRCRWTTCS